MESARSSLQDRCLQLVKDNDPLLAVMSCEDIDKKVNDMVKHFQAILQPIEICKTDIALELLVQTGLGSQETRVWYCII